MDIYLNFILAIRGYFERSVFETRRAKCSYCYGGMKSAIVIVILPFFKLGSTQKEIMYCSLLFVEPGRVAQSVGHLTHKSEVLGSIPGLATYFRFSFR